MMTQKKFNFFLTGFSKNHVQLLNLLIHQELTLRYKRSVIGIGWALLNPMLTSFVLWVVFSFLFVEKLQTGQQFAPYLMAGILLNTFFNQGLLQAANSIAANGAILTKVSVPPKIFTFASSLAAFINFLIGLMPLTVVVYVSGQTIDFSALLILIIGLFLSLFISGLGLALSVIFIRFEDAKNIVHVLLLILLYLTPVFYPISILNDTMQRIVNLNPLTSFLDAFRWSFSNNATFSKYDFMYLSCSSITIFILGNLAFKRYWPRTVSML
jgi:ABC-2 type transport system permease protein/lipopolysaccharide transport system permease protein